ncbi:MAG: hypothetical protein JNM60_09610 [Candidatus Competibacteraceae bacterium]|nr:hypothetical protein [Candidatus Competibacteraceae bacterium]
MDVPSLELVAALVTYAAQQLHRLFENAGFVIGFAFVGMGLYGCYACAKDRFRRPWNALALCFAGVGLVYLGNWYHAASATFLAIDHTLMYAPPTSDWSTLMMGACVTVLQLLGLVACQRAWFLTRLVGSGELGRLALSRASVFFVAGVLALNIVQTVRVLFATLGTTSPLG